MNLETASRIQVVAQLAGSISEAMETKMAKPDTEPFLIL
jgi:hypothetical protein